MLNSTSLLLKSSQAGSAPFRMRNIAVQLFWWLAFIGSIGICNDQNQKAYLGVLALIVCVAYLIAYRSAHRSHEYRVERIGKDNQVRVLFIAIFIGTCVNILAEEACSYLGLKTIPSSAFSAGYRMLIIALTPMPIFPGDRVYYQLPLNNRIWSFGLIVVSFAFFREYRLLLPFLFMLSDVMLTTRDHINSDNNSAPRSLYSSGTSILFTGLVLALIHSKH